MSDQNANANEQMIPKSRLDQVLEQKRQLQSQLETLASKMSELETTVKSAEGLTSRIAELESSLEATKFKASTERTMLQAGLRDEEGLQVAQMLYDALPEDNKPSLQDWLKSPPRAVQAYLAPAESNETTAQPEQVVEAPAEVTSAPQPQANRGAIPQPSNTSPYSADSINQMSPSEYQAQRESILAALR